MKYDYLGNTSLLVSRICFGSLTIGPLQRNLSLEKGTKVIEHAIDSGVNFIDTAELYGTYQYIKEAIKRTKKEIVVATKSYAYSEKMMIASLEKARKEMDKDQIDIFLLHEQESILTVKGHWEAVEYLLKAKDQGLIKAIGLSTHSIAGVKAALEYSELEIIHPIFNYKGIGIQDGNIDEMLETLSVAKSKGKGIYGMKPLGGGNLIDNSQEALKWTFSRKEIDSIAIGMQSKAEVNTNIAWLLEEDPNQEDLDELQKLVRKLHIGDYCSGCGRCVKKCKYNALSIVNRQAYVNQAQCILCGYCGSVCPLFAIKII